MSDIEDKKESNEIDFTVVEPKEDVKAEPVSQLSEIEEEAYKQGWRPDGGNKTAEEFLKDGALIDRIKERGQQLKKKDKQIDTLTQYVKTLTENVNKIKENAYKEALEKLESEKNVALAVGDIDAARQANTKIEETKQQQANELPAPLAAFAAKYEDLLKPKFHELEINKLAEAVSIREFIIKTDVALGNIPDLSPEQHADKLEQALLATYKNSDLLKNHIDIEDDEIEEEPPKKIVQAVEPVQSSGKIVRKAKYSVNDLSSEQRQMMKDLIRVGLTTEAQFIENQALAGLIGKF